MGKTYFTTKGPVSYRCTRNYNEIPIEDKVEDPDKILSYRHNCSPIRFDEYIFNSNNIIRGKSKAGKKIDKKTSIYPSIMKMAFIMHKLYDLGQNYYMEGEFEEFLKNAK